MQSNIVKKLSKMSHIFTKNDIINQPVTAETKMHMLMSMPGCYPSFSPNERGGQMNAQFSVGFMGRGIIACTMPRAFVAKCAF